MLFLLISVIYVTSLAVVDATFNRLVFGDIRKLPYNSLKKKSIYRKWEWRCIGVVLLIVLPVIIPSILSYLIGGVNYLVGYWVVLLAVQWDMIFGRLVFDDWWGDKPSIALPFVGWMQFNIYFVVKVRLLLALILVLFLMYHSPLL